MRRWWRRQVIWLMLITVVHLATALRSTQQLEPATSDIAQPLFTPEEFKTLDTRLLDSFRQPFQRSASLNSRDKRKIDMALRDIVNKLSFSTMQFNFRGKSSADRVNSVERIRLPQRFSIRDQPFFIPNQEISVLPSDFQFEASDAADMMELLKKMPSEFRKRFISLLLESDRDGILDLVREMIEFHMKSETSARAKSLTDRKKSRNNFQRRPIPLHQTQFSSRQGDLDFEKGSKNLPVIESAIILHRETISEPGKIISSSGRSFSDKQRDKSRKNGQRSIVSQNKVSANDNVKVMSQLLSNISEITNSMNKKESNNPDLANLLDQIRHTPAFGRIMENILSMLKAEEKLNQLSNNAGRANSGKSVSGSTNFNNEVSVSNKPDDIPSPSIQRQESISQLTNQNKDIREQVHHQNNFQNRFEESFPTTIENRLNNDFIRPSNDRMNHLNSVPSTLSIPINTDPNQEHFDAVFFETDQQPETIDSFLITDPQFNPSLFDHFATPPGVELPDFSSPTPVFPTQEHTIVPLSTDIEGQLFDEAINNFNQQQQGSSTATSSFGETNEFGFGTDVQPSQFVPLSTDFEGQLQGIPTQNSKSSRNNAQITTENNDFTNFNNGAQTNGQFSGFELSNVNEQENLQMFNDQTTLFQQNPNNNQGFQSNFPTNSLTVADLLSLQGGSQLNNFQSDVNSPNLQSNQLADNFIPIGVPIPSNLPPSPISNSATNRIPAEKPDEEFDFPSQNMKTQNIIGDSLPSQSGDNLNVEQSGGNFITENISSSPSFAGSGVNFASQFDTVLQTGRNIHDIGIPLPEITASQPDIFQQNPNFEQSGHRIQQVGIHLPTAGQTPANPFATGNQFGVPLPGNQFGVPLPGFHNDSAISQSQNPFGFATLDPESRASPGLVFTNFEDLEEFDGDVSPEKNLEVLIQPVDFRQQFTIDEDSFESFGIQDAGFQKKRPSYNYDAIDEKGYPKSQKNYNGHQLVTFLTPGVLFPYSGNDKMYKNNYDLSNEDSQVYLLPSISPFDYDINAHQAPSTKYTAPPRVIPQYRTRGKDYCESRTIVMTTVLAVDRPASVTTIIERLTSVHLVNSYLVTPVTVVQTYTASTTVNHDTYEIQGQSQHHQYNTPYLLDQTVRIGRPVVSTVSHHLYNNGNTPVGRGGHYVTRTKLVHTTVFRTLTQQVPQTVVTTRHRVSTLRYGKTLSTVLSTSIICMPTAYAPKEKTYEVDVKYAVAPEGRTPLIPSYRDAHVVPTPRYNTDPSLYRTWIGSLADTNSYEKSEDIDVPSKFILLQHMWPRGFIVQNRYNSGTQHIKLTHGDSFQKRRLELSLDDSVENSSNEFVPISRPLLQGSFRQ